MNPLSENKIAWLRKRPVWMRWVILSPIAVPMLLVSKTLGAIWIVGEAADRLHYKIFGEYS